MTDDDHIGINPSGVGHDDLRRLPDPDGQMGEHAAHAGAGHEL